MGRVLTLPLQAHSPFQANPGPVSKGAEDPELPKVSEAPNHHRLLAVSNAPEAKADEVLGTAVLKQKPLLGGQVFSVYDGMPSAQPSSWPTLATP